MAEQAFPLHISTLGYLFYGRKNTHEGEVFASLSLVCNYLVKIIAQKFEFN